MKIYVYPYKQGSASAKAIARELGGLVIKRKNSKFKKWNSDKVAIINWGSSSWPSFDRCKFLFNEPNTVLDMGNKLTALHIFDESFLKPRIPGFTTEKEVVAQWLEEGLLVVARATLTGHSGEGISILDPKISLDIPDAMCYTKYVKKASEYRVHFIDYSDPSPSVSPFFIQKKVKRKDFEGEVNFKIRSHANGFVFAHNDLDVPEDVIKQARSAFLASNLNFGAVDVIYNKKKGEAYVLEINTAPGLEGTTVKKYGDAFRTYLGLNGQSEGSTVSPISGDNTGHSPATDEASSEL